jgi:Hypoxia induced protein conserved region
MATHVDRDDHIVISDDDARGGVTGHNVRYVLEFGLASVIAAFAAIALYFGFDRLQAKLSAMFSAGSLRNLALYVIIALLGVIVARALFWAWSRIEGPSEDESQRFMRTRVVTQFAIICAIMAISYLALA